MALLKLILLSFVLVLPLRTSSVLLKPHQDPFLSLNVKYSQDLSIHSRAFQDDFSTTKIVARLARKSLPSVARGTSYRIRLGTPHLHPAFLKFMIREGLNGDPCLSKADCQGDRRCLLVLPASNSPEDCTPEALHCFCLLLDSYCRSSSDCDDGEVCFDFAESEEHACVSEATAGNINGSFVDDSSPVNDGSVPLGIESETDGQGLTYDPCLSNDDCQDDRVCLKLNGDILSELCAPGDLKCFCASPNPFCSSNSDCDDGEVCFHPPHTEKPLCISEIWAKEMNISNVDNSVPSESNDLEFGELEQSPAAEDECQSRDDCQPGEVCIDTDGSLKCINPTDEVIEESSEVEVVSAESFNVCIAAHHLSEMSRDKLMYPKHILARVLCDKFNNCATPGHIVVYKGRSMMMSSYCGIEHCAEINKEVNGLKYVRGKLLPSNSDELRFSAFAARYNSRVEEAVLSLAIRMGL